MYTIRCLFFDDAAFHRKIHQIFPDCLRRHLEQIDRPRDQLWLRQIGMSLSRSLLQTIEQTAPDTKIRIRADAYLRRDLIRDTEADTINIVRQPVRILLQNTVQFFPVCIVDLDCQRQIDAILLQKEHRRAQCPFFLDLNADLLRFPLTDTFDLGKPFRFFLDDTEGLCTEPSDYARRQRSAHAFDRSRS